MMKPEHHRHEKCQLESLCPFVPSPTSPGSLILDRSVIAKKFLCRRLMWGASMDDINHSGQNSASLVFFGCWTWHYMKSRCL
jgi:hypothetical protein